MFSVRNQKNRLSNTSIILIISVNNDSTTFPNRFHNHLTGDGKLKSMTMKLRGPSIKLWKLEV